MFILAIDLGQSKSVFVMGDDALKLLRPAMVSQINPVHIPPAEMRQWRGRLKAREAAVIAQARCKVRIRALLATAWAILRDQRPYQTPGRDTAVTVA